MSNFDRDSRARKLAQALSDGDWQVDCLGIVTRFDDSRTEDLGYARLTRVVTSSVPFQLASVGVDPVACRADASSEALPLWRRSLLLAARIRWIDDLRHFLGRRREARLMARATNGTVYELVICCNPVTLPVGRIVGKRDRAAVIYDVREVWTEQSLNTTRLYRWLYRQSERSLLRHVDAVIAVNDLVGADFARRYPGRRPYAILNGASECRVPNPRVARPVRLLFQGRFAADRGLPQLVMAMRSLRGKAVLTLQGFEGIEAEIRQLVEDEDLSDVVRFEAPVQPSETVAAASAHDVGVIPYAPETLNLFYSSPNKLFDYLGAGLAIASSDIPFARELIETHECGTIFDATNPGSMVAALEALCEDEARLGRMKVAAATACSETSWPIMAERLRKIAAVLVGSTMASKRPPLSPRLPRV